MSAIAFDVTGRPAPQGSKRALGPGRMIEMSKYVAAWRSAVRAAAIAQTSQEPAWAPIDAPVALTVVFYLARPQRPRWWAPAVVPDLSKLVRASEDAMTGVIFADDARVVDLTTSKRYAIDREPGAWIHVTTIDAEERAA